MSMAPMSPSVKGGHSFCILMTASHLWRGMRADVDQSLRLLRK